MATEYHVSATLPATAAHAYRSWLDSDGHSGMTGAAAEIEPRPGGTHKAWDGYISGTILELEDDRRIVMSWRTMQFGADDADSQVVVTFSDTASGVLVEIDHTGIPEGQPDYGDGWRVHYFEPMAGYFAS